MSHPPSTERPNMGEPGNSDNYHQNLANKTGKPVYCGPDNLNGGSHWKYPQRKIRPCPGLEAPEQCSLDVAHHGDCVPTEPEHPEPKARNLGELREQLDAILDAPRRAGQDMKVEIIAIIEQRERHLSAQLEHDRSQVADGVTAIKKSLTSRHWLTEGRGSYSYDDDKWHDEFAAAIVEIDSALEPLARIAGDWKNCPVDGESIRKARQTIEQREREAWEKAATFVEYCATHDVNDGVVHVPGSIQPVDLRRIAYGIRHPEAKSDGNNQLQGVSL